MSATLTGRTPDPIIYIIEPYGGSVREHNPNLPHLYYDDLAVTRGEAATESILVRGGRAGNLDRHLERFAHSAGQLGLPEVQVEQWRSATIDAARQWDSAHEGVDARCAWTLSRGRASTGLATAWMVVTPVSEAALRQREAGVTVLTTTRGFTPSKETPEWMPAGAKTTNYAASMAAVRYAKAQGCDDVIFLDSPRGRVLEGATSSVVIAKKGRKLRAPQSGEGSGVLASTAQAALFDAASAAGWKVKQCDISYDDLLSADSVWLLSSTRMAARVRKLDGTKLSAGELEGEVRALAEQALTA